MLTIDRFEKDVAVCQTPSKEIRTIRRCELPADCREGDTIIFKDGVFVRTDNEARREAMKKKMQGLFKKA